MLYHPLAATPAERKCPGANAATNCSGSSANGRRAPARSHLYVRFLRRNGEWAKRNGTRRRNAFMRPRPPARSEEHTSELQSLMRISYAVFCLKKKTEAHSLKSTAHAFT